LFNIGDGQDTIADDGYYGGTDRIVFGAGIAPGDVVLARSGSDLVLRIAGNGNRITVRVRDYFSGARYQIEQIVFADGTVWDQVYLNGHDFTANTNTGENEYNRHR
jgi:hypothetical protein